MVTATYAAAQSYYVARARLELLSNAGLKQFLRPDLSNPIAEVVADPLMFESKKGQSRNSSAISLPFPERLRLFRLAGAVEQDKQDLEAALAQMIEKWDPEGLLKKQVASVALQFAYGVPDADQLRLVREGASHATFEPLVKQLSEKPDWQGRHSTWKGSARAGGSWEKGYNGSEDRWRSSPHAWQQGWAAETTTTSRWQAQDEDADWSTWSSWNDSHSKHRRTR